MMAYKAFVSYSHAADKQLAPLLQSALQRFAKPFYKLRAINIFRDKTSLRLTPELWPEIQKATRQSEFFILLASPDSAKSQWVQKRTALRRLALGKDGAGFVVTSSPVPRRSRDAGCGASWTSKGNDDW